MTTEQTNQPYGPGEVHGILEYNLASKPELQNGFRRLVSAEHNATIGNLVYAQIGRVAVTDSDILELPRYYQPTFMGEKRGDIPLGIEPSNSLIIVHFLKENLDPLVDYVSCVSPALPFRPMREMLRELGYHKRNVDEPVLLKGQRYGADAAAFVTLKDTSSEPLLTELLDSMNPRIRTDTDDVEPLVIDEDPT